MGRKSQKPVDANLAIHAAIHFFELAGKFFQQLPDDKSAFDSFFKQPKNIGQLIAATTNLAFSTELYLKGIAIKTKGRAIASHDLASLFNDLPKDVRDLIQERYQRRFTFGKKPNLRTIYFIISTHNQPPPDVAKHARILSGADEQDVCKLLSVERDAFERWRYVYEQAPPAGWVAVFVHFGLLGILVNALQDLFIPEDKRP